ncbi:hypothetical protein, partial [Methylobrevis pamukkalensis]|uniref:hypothetical protein n=1 Tax=Methylobrevis pamukkalensis TaxID=1439726 RepID=UPI003CCA50ED
YARAQALKGLAAAPAAPATADDDAPVTKTVAPTTTTTGRIRPAADRAREPAGHAAARPPAG